MNSNNENIQERILLKKAIERGNIGLLSEIYKKHKPFLKKRLKELTNLNGYAEDLTHEVFLAISQRQCNYNGHTDVRGYLYGIAKKLAARHNHRQTKQRLYFTENFPGEIAREKSSNPVEKIHLEEVKISLFEAISKLPQKSRQAVELVIVHNLRPYQAAKKCGCSLSALRKRLNRGQARLREELKDLL